MRSINGNTNNHENSDCLGGWRYTFLSRENIPHSFMRNIMCSFLQTAISHFEVIDWLADHVQASDRSILSIQLTHMFVDSWNRSRLKSLGIRWFLFKTNVIVKLTVGGAVLTFANIHTYILKPTIYWSINQTIDSWRIIREQQPSNCNKQTKKERLLREEGASIYWFICRRNATSEAKQQTISIFRISATKTQ